MRKVVEPFMKLFNGSGRPPVIGGMAMEKLLESSFTARAGLRLIRAAAAMRASSAIIAVVICLLSAEPA
ncbi:MAG TPA: hypothetical protein VFS27_04650, partial [Blastocatellia bacterium]|nr:hypothetical protein [Blastocatellia bacterium]